MLEFTAANVCTTPDLLDGAINISHRARTGLKVPLPKYFTPLTFFKWQFIKLCQHRILAFVNVNSEQWSKHNVLDKSRTPLVTVCPAASSANSSRPADQFGNAAPFHMGIYVREALE